MPVGIRTRISPSPHVRLAGSSPTTIFCPGRCVASAGYIFGVGSSAGNIIGATGFVMEAVPRTAYALVVKKNPEPDICLDVRGMDWWKEQTFNLTRTSVRAAVVIGPGNADKLIRTLK